VIFESEKNKNEVFGLQVPKYRPGIALVVNNFRGPLFDSHDVDGHVGLALPSQGECLWIFHWHWKRGRWRIWQVFGINVFMQLRVDMI
jgi:hypothetical protein